MDQPSGLIGLYAQIACIWEVLARKPGNVHRYAAFADVGLVDFLQSAAAIAPIVDTAWQKPVGETVLEGMRATRRVTTSNTNLGILLLLAPLASVPLQEDLRTGVVGILDRLTVADAQGVYAAIRLANAGGLGEAAQQDIRAEPTLTLREVMTLAAQRDLVARQYANGFAEVFGKGLEALRQAWQDGQSLENVIISTYLYFLASFPDSLIARKQGVAEAEEASQRAAAVLALGGLNTSTGQAALADLDQWLRAQGNRRNPGTTADLVTACLFVALRENIIPLPCTRRWAE